MTEPEPPLPPGLPVPDGGWPADLPRPVRLVKPSADPLTKPQPPAQPAEE